MDFVAADLRRLRFSLALVLALLAVGAAAVLAARHFATEARKVHAQALAEANDVKGRLARARDEEQEIRAKIARYQDLVARGYVGQEARLEWVEQIGRIRNARRLIGLDYEMTPQKPVEPALLPAGAVGGGYEFMSSSMRLQMQLLHEGDLLGFLDDLRRGVQALVVVRSCSIERVTRTGGERGPAAQLAAECLVDWITLREKK